MKNYDYIFAGGGMAGLSLAYYLSQYENLRDKQFLIIDRDAKDKNDRTWCFWEKGRGEFDTILYRQWKGVYFHSQTFSQFIDLQEYSYKMIRGIDFYSYVISHLKQCTNVTFLQAEVKEISNNTVTVQGFNSSKVQEFNDTSIPQYSNTPTQQFVANAWVFDSVHQFKLNLPQYHNLLQHFKGWVIQTSTPKFDPEKPTMMDFRIEQHNECRFFYVMPFSATEAMIEFTLFTEKLLSPEVYNDELKKYLKDFLQITDYQIIDEEFGIIPMTDEPTRRFPAPQVMRIGTAGGSTKPSTGYTFVRTQHHLQRIAQNIAYNHPLEEPQTLRERHFLWLDKVFLNVLQQKRVPAPQVFTRLFERNPIIRLLRFLDEESSLAENIGIMRTLPIWQFTKAAFSTIF